MRSYKKNLNRGFTLVELMIVVAIIGVLAALAIYGVRRYLASAKTSEAKNTIGAITRAAVQAYEREKFDNKLLDNSEESATASHTLCVTPTNPKVPDAPPPGKKYQPSTDPAEDFNVGTALQGWKCLQFNTTQPIYYSYGYATGTGTGLSGATGTGFEVTAEGDLNGDGSLFSLFARGADVRDGEVVLSSTIFVQNEFE